MIDVYNLQELDPIEESRLIQMYRQSKASMASSLTVWGDTLGKPGDVLYSLKDLIVRNTTEVVFEFKGSQITVHNLKEIFVNEMIIAIKTCDKIIWHDTAFNVKIEYVLDKVENILRYNVLKGNHSPRVDITDPCFMLAA